MALKLSSVVEYLLVSAALYIFVVSPLLRTYFPLFVLVDQESQYQSFEKTDALVIPDPGLQCEPHAYEVRILSLEPLVVYIEGFLSGEEAEHLVEVSYGTLVKYVFFKLLISIQKCPLHAIDYPQRIRGII